MKTFYICDDCSNEISLSEFNQPDGMVCKECRGKIEKTSKEPLKDSGKKNKPKQKEVEPCQLDETGLCLNCKKA